jgi:Xaa-Pro aminopeptidase
MESESTLMDRRLARVRNAMREMGLDALFLNYGSDFAYVSGLETPLSYDVGRQPGDWISGLVVPLESDPVLVFRRSWMGEFSGAMPIEIRVAPDDEDPDAFLASTVQSLGLDGKRIGVPKTIWGQTLLSLQSALPEARFVALSDVVVDRIRSIKDAGEIALLEQAALITDEAFAAVVNQIRVGMSDRDLSIEIEYQLKRHGGDAMSFTPTVVIDGHGHRWARNWLDREPPQPLTYGMSLAFDLGVVYRGYCSDFGRSAFIGEPNPTALAAWESITRVNQQTLEMMGDGKITPSGIHDYVVELVSEDGFRDQFSWYALGHCVGLDVHENPWMLPGFDEPIRAGMVFALEPKIGIPGQFYVRCEDIVVVEQERARPLTRYPYDPIIID